MPAELSVVVPTLHEEAALPALLGGLAQQEGVALELIVADGGSRDSTRGVFAAFAAAAPPFPVRWLDAPAGRGAQMNAGAALAQAADLLFLHADSTLDDPQLLLRGLAHLRAERTRRGTDRLAGHFPLRFRGGSPEHAGTYFYLEALSASSRRDTVNGDQGFLLSRRFFEALGGFDATLPFLEDLRLAQRVFEHGAWVRLPGALETSARRFESEGIANRLLASYLVRAAEKAGLGHLLRALGYRPQHQAATPLALAPAVQLARESLRALGWRQRASVWKRVGAYNRGLLWHLPFQHDCRRGRRRGESAHELPTPLTAAFERAWNPLTQNGLAITALALTSWLLFQVASLAFWLRPGPLDAAAVREQG